MNHFCTITTQSHLYKVYALADSLAAHGINPVLHVLVTDSNQLHSYSNCVFYNVNQCAKLSAAKTICEKYKRFPDKMRWSLKPVLLHYLLNLPEIDKAIYIDNDIYFYNGYEFLFSLLNNHSFLLTPHFYKNSPHSDQNWLEANFRVGLFNAGFVAVNKNALKRLEWWADCCAYRCEKNALRGTFDDQKYLDLIPVLEPSCLILQHKGCNVAGWNQELCKRELFENEVLIEGKYPVVFIHFNFTTIREIANNNDVLLKPHYQQYLSNLLMHKPALKENEMLVKESVTDKVKLAIWNLITNAGL